MSTIGFIGMVKDVGALRAYASEVNGARKADFLASAKRQGFKKQRIFLAETPTGPMVLGYFDGPNAGFNMASLAASSNPFDKYQLEQVIKMSGVDFRNLPPGPPPHFVFEWTNGKPGRTYTMLGAPVPDPSKLWKLCREMSMRIAEHKESRERHGVTLEQVFYLHDAKMVAAYIEADDAPAALQGVIASTAAYDKWFVDQLAVVHGVDFRAAAPPKAELLVSYDG